MAALLRLHKASRIYDGAIAALDGVSLEVAPGELVGLVGPSGSGKSTLLSIAAGFETLTSGGVFFDERPLSQWIQTELLTAHIGVLFQRFFLVNHLSACENLELALFETCDSANGRRQRSLELLDRVGLVMRAHTRAGRLSGGERQRVAFCRSIANEPDLLLADEPTGSLDSHSKQALLDLMVEHHRERHAAILVATHDPDVSAICQRIIRLSDGRVVNP